MLFLPKISPCHYHTIQIHHCIISWQTDRQTPPARKKESPKIYCMPWRSTNLEHLGSNKEYTFKMTAPHRQSSISRSLSMTRSDDGESMSNSNWWAVLLQFYIQLTRTDSNTCFNAWFSPEKTCNVSAPCKENQVDIFKWWTYEEHLIEQTTSIHFALELPFLKLGDTFQPYCLL